MKKVKKIVTSSLFMAIVFNVIAIIAAYIIAGFWYETNDDPAMMMFAAQRGDERLVFMNVLYGYILKGLYSVTTAVNWYALVFYGLAFVCFTAITNIILETLKGKIIGKLASVLFLIVFAVNVYNMMQFTKMTAIVTAAAILIICYNVEKSKPWQTYIFPCLLFLMGSLLRFKVLYITIPAFGAVLLLFIIKYFFLQKDRSQRKKVYIFGCIALVLSGMSFFGQLAQGLYIKNHPDYGDYLERNLARAHAMDYGFSKYEKVKDKYEEIGISENDYYMLVNTMICDPEYFTEEKFNDIESVEKSERYKSFMQSLKHSVSATLSQIFNEWHIISLQMLCVIFAVALLLMLKKNAIPHVLMSFALILGYYLLFNFLGRFVYWIAYSVVITGFLVMLTALIFNEVDVDNIEIQINKNKLSSLIILVLITSVVVQYLYKNTYSIYARREARNEIVAEKQYLNSESDNLYFRISPAMILLYLRYDAFDTDFDNSSDNIINLCGFEHQIPYTKKVMEDHGITNPIKALYEMDNVYFVSQVGNDYYYSKNSAMDVLKNYINEHYDPTVTYRFEYNVGSKIPSNFVLDKENDVEEADFDETNSDETDIEEGDEEQIEDKPGLLKVYKFYRQEQ